MKKKARKKLEIRPEILRILALAGVSGGLPSDTRPTGPIDLCIPRTKGEGSCTCPTGNGCPSDCPTQTTNCEVCPLD